MGEPLHLSCLPTNDSTVVKKHAHSLRVVICLYRLCLVVSQTAKFVICMTACRDPDKGRICVFNDPVKSRYASDSNLKSTIYAGLSPYTQ